MIQLGGSVDVGNLALLHETQHRATYFQRLRIKLTALQFAAQHMVVCYYHRRAMGQALEAVAASTKREMLPRRALEHMDLLRGGAALAVLVFHTRGLFFLDWSSLQRPGPLLRLVYLVTGFGHQAVIVFFVLSGFFIGSSVLASTAAGRWSWRDFLLRRLTRLYLVLIPALVLTAAIDLLGMRLFGIQNIYTGVLNAPFTKFNDVRQTLGPRTFAANLFFLQSFVSDVYGTNGPLWSLSFEFWSYLVFPLLVLVAHPSTGRLGRVASALLAMTAFLVLGSLFVFYFSIWTLGAVAALIWRYLLRVRAPGRAGMAACLALFAAALLAARLEVYHSAKIGDITLGFSTAVLLLVLLWNGGDFAEKPVGSDSYRWIAALLASFSYTLYLIHFPILAFFNAALVHRDRWTPDARHAVIAVLIAAAVLIIVYPLARVTEGRTEQVRKVLVRFLA